LGGDFENGAPINFSNHMDDSKVFGSTDDYMVDNNLDTRMVLGRFELDMELNSIVVFFDVYDNC